MVDAVNQKQSSGFPTGAFIGGAAVGAGATYFTKFGKKPIGLEELTSDQFTKTKDKLATAEEKANGTIVENYLKTKPATAPAKSSTSTTTPVTDRSKTIKAKVKAETTAYFGESGADVPSSRVLSGKTPERFQEKVIEPLIESNNKIGTSIDKLNEQFAANRTKLERSQTNLLDLEEIKKQEKATKTDAEKAMDASLEKDYTTAKTEYAEAKKALDSASKGLPDDELNALKEDVLQKKLKVVELGKELRPDYRKAVEQYKEDHRTAVQEKADAKEALEDTTERAREAKIDADTAKRAKAADAEAKKEIADQLKKEVEEKQSILKTKEANVSDLSKVIKENLNPTADKRISSATKRIQTARDSEKTISNQIKAKGTELETGLNNLALQEAKLDLAKGAADGKITRTAFRESLSAKLGDVKLPESKIGEAAKSIPETVKAAFEAIKGHLPTKINGGKLAIGAAIGAVVFAIVGGMMGGKKETPEA